MKELCDQLKHIYVCKAQKTQDYIALNQSSSNLSNNSKTVTLKKLEENNLATSLTSLVVVQDRSANSYETFSKNETITLINHRNIKNVCVELYFDNKLINRIMAVHFQTIMNQKALVLIVKP